jgi:hypothetical protein
VPGPQPPPLSHSDGAAAEAIRAAESALAHQSSLTAQVDLQVVTAVLNAHTDHAGAVALLERLQDDIEAAVLIRTDLDTPAGAREFQRYLLEKLRDIRTAVDTAGLDATSQATLAAALASLYASTGSDTPNAGSSVESDDRSPAELPLPDAAADYLPVDVPPGEYPPPATAPPAAAVSPAWGGGAPATGSALGGGLPTLPTAASPGFPIEQPPIDWPVDNALPDTESESEVSEAADSGPSAQAPPEASTVDGLTVQLPDGQNVTAPNAQLAAVITAAVAGTSIPDAFSAQGITIPAPGSAIAVPVEPGRLVPGDIGLFADRHALALGSGQILLDNVIQPLGTMADAGFIGWLQPPVQIATG